MFNPPHFDRDHGVQVAINPVLISVSVTGKRRKRRDLDTVIQVAMNDNDVEEDFYTVMQANQSDGISPELEEKIHEMQVKFFQSSIPNTI